MYYTQHKELADTALKLGSGSILFKNRLANSEELCIYYRLGQSFWELLLWSYVLAL